MTTTLDIIILRHLGIEAGIEGEGTDRALDTAVPGDLADRAVADLTAAGYEASWAPDHDDPGLAWIYIMPDEDGTA